MWLFRDAIVFASATTNIPAARDVYPAPTPEAFELSLRERERARRKYQCD